MNDHFYLNGSVFPDGTQSFCLSKRCKAYIYLTVYLISVKSCDWIKNQNYFQTSRQSMHSVVNEKSTVTKELFRQINSLVTRFNFFIIKYGTFTKFVRKMCERFP